MKKIVRYIIFLILVILIIFAIFYKTKETKKYENDSISFSYSTNYKLYEFDDYFELKNKTSNITVESRLLNSIENSKSFKNIVDNIVFNYLNQNDKYKLISSYPDYKLGDKVIARLIFENPKENLKSLILVSLENLNLIIVNLNAYSNEFELLIDSAEYIIKTYEIKEEKIIISKDDLLFKNIQSYSTYESKYDDDTSKVGQIKYKNYTANINYSNKANIVDREEDIFKISYDKLKVEYEFIRTTDELVCEEYESGCQMSDGYYKYDDKYYHIYKKIYYKGSDNYDVIRIADELNYETMFTATIVGTNSYISEEVIGKVIDNYEVIEDNTHSEIVDGYIRGEVIDPKLDKKVIYKLPQKYNIEKHAGTYYSIYYIKLNNYYGSVSMQIKEGNYEASFINNFEAYYKDKENYKLESSKVTINNNEFTKYVKTYTDTFLDSKYEYRDIYYFLNLYAGYQLYIELDDKYETVVEEDILANLEVVDNNFETDVNVVEGVLTYHNISKEVFYKFSNKYNVTKSSYPRYYAQEEYVIEGGSWKERVRMYLTPYFEIYQIGDLKEEKVIINNYEFTKYTNIKKYDTGEYVEIFYILEIEDNYKLILEPYNSSVSEAYIQKAFSDLIIRDKEKKELDYFEKEITKEGVNKKIKFKIPEIYNFQNTDGYVEVISKDKTSNYIYIRISTNDLSWRKDSKIVEEKIEINGINYTKYIENYKDYDNENVTDIYYVVNLDDKNKLIIDNSDNVSINVEKEILPNLEIVNF